VPQPPHVPPHPSSPQTLFAHDGTHEPVCESASHVDGGVQEPQTPPQQFEPQFQPNAEQSAHTLSHLPLALQAKGHWLLGSLMHRPHTPCSPGAPQPSGPQFLPPHWGLQKAAHVQAFPPVGSGAAACPHAYEPSATG
jgi:hypothetical protein